MSLYVCIDLINEQMKQLSSGDRTFGQAIRHFFSSSAEQKHREASLADLSLLKGLKAKLIKRIEEDNYTDLSSDVGIINQYLNNEYSLSRSYLNYIANDINAIDIKFKKMQKKAEKVGGIHNQNNPPSTGYEKFQSPTYRVAEITQGELPKLGLSPGECLGISYSMVNPNLSPYHNPGVKIDLNQEIHNYQKFQRNRAKDQGTIKQSRLTREYFCPDKEKQARDILEFAQQHQGKELLLTRRGSVGAHASYLSVQENGYIRYMEPNHGAYLFQNTQDFHDFYVAAAKEDKEWGADFRFYSLAVLQYDGGNEKKETKNLEGNLRSLLTGSKYSDNYMLSKTVTSGAYVIAAGGVGAGIGALIGSVVPFIGTIIGAVVGAALGAISGAGLVVLANDRGHDGLLGVPHYIQDTWQDIKESVLDFVFPAPKNNITPETINAKDDASCSTSAILSLINEPPAFTESFVPRKKTIPKDFPVPIGSTEVLQSEPTLSDTKRDEHDNSLIQSHAEHVGNDNIIAERLSDENDRNNCFSM